MQTKQKLSVAIITLSLLGMGCADHKLPAPFQCSDDPVTVELVSVVESDCALKDGSIEVRATGGTGAYQFRIGDGVLQSASVFVNLGAGVYEVSAFDDKNCGGTLEVSVQNKNGVNISVQTTDAGCKDFKGTIEVQAFDGVEPYQFRIDASSFSDKNTFDGLASGNHVIVVKDDTGCEVAQTVKLKSGVSYSSSIKTIIEKNCAVSGCHNGSQFPDLRTFDNIQKNAGQIKNLTGNRTMPQNGSLTQSEIDLIACWVDDGAVSN